MSGTKDLDDLDKCPRQMSQTNVPDRPIVPIFEIANSHGHIGEQVRGDIEDWLTILPE